MENPARALTSRFRASGRALTQIIQTESNNETPFYV
jgi:hypothetical protein